MSADTKQWPKSDRRGTPTVAEFCEQHDLIDEFVPFEHRAYDPWELARAFDAEFEALPKTAATLTANILFERVAGTRDVWTNRIRTPLYLIGSWPLDDPDGRPGRWVNPYYPHERALAPVDVESRMSHLETCAKLGAFRVEDLTPRFGVGIRSLERYTSNREFHYGEARRQGKRRLARTAITAKEWTGRSLRALARPLAVHYNTLRTWTYRFCRDADWEVPDDPSLGGGGDS